MTAAALLPATITVIERGWLSSNNIVFDDDGEASVVDTGYGRHAAQTVQLVRAAIGGRPLTRIVNTHLHSDHVGGNAALQAAFGAAILIPPGLSGAVERWDEEALSYTPMAQQCPRFRHEAVIEPGAVLMLGGLAWQVMAAPGHDAHMVVLYNEAQRILISADALWEDGFGAMLSELEGRSSFAEERAVLDWIDRLKPRLVIPGHGRPFVDVPAALDRAVRRLEALAASPDRNARHIAKVMVKFLLLELRSIALPDLIERLTPTRYLQTLQQRFFPDRTAAALIERAVAELLASGAVVRNGDRIENRDD
jgi:glyoxylase-like metal-dependent hydrolase (beta-lactamase superfamily II)